MIPDFQTIMLPLLEILGDKTEHRLKELITNISDLFKLTETERNELLPSGNQAIINNRVGWAITYMKKAGLILSPQRATFIITENGVEVISKKTANINVAFLKKLPKFQKWQEDFSSKVKAGNEIEEVIITTDKSPQEIIDHSFQEINSLLSIEILDLIKVMDPHRFEQLVIDLLIKMGYGGSKIEAGNAIGKSGDGGIDGIINEDKLGLDTIYIQAKRWSNSINIKDVRDFAEALLSKKSRKGVFIATSCFPKSAYEFIGKIEPKIILIDGNKLVNLMIEYNLGVTIETKYEVKKVDTDYFIET